MHGRAETLFALLELALCPTFGSALLGIAHGPLDRRDEPRPIVLDHVIDRPLLQGLDGALFTYRAGYEYERSVRPLA